MKYDDRIEELKEKLYAGILCDVLDQKGYRNQTLSDAINGVNLLIDGGITSHTGQPCTGTY